METRDSMASPLDKAIRPGLTVRAAIGILTPEARVRLLGGLIEQQDTAVRQRAERRSVRLGALGAVGAATLIIVLLVPFLRARLSVTPGGVITYERMLYFNSSCIPSTAVVEIIPQQERSQTTVEAREISILGMRTQKVTLGSAECIACNGPFGVNRMDLHNERVRIEAQRLVDTMR